MPLKIRCPHCKRTLVAEDDTAGQGKRCPACGMGFTVPIPVCESPQHVEVAGKCPKCRADMAPGTEYCPHCYYDPAAGKRLPLRRRLQFVSVRAWTVTGLGVVVLVALIFSGVRIYEGRIRRGEYPASAPAVARKPIAVGSKWVKQLLEAESAADRTRAFEALLSLGSAALPELARGVEESARVGGGQQTRNRAAAVELFARGGEEHWLPLLKKLQNEEGLRETVLVARALLGDDEVAEELSSLWLTALRRQMFLTRVAELSPGRQAHAIQASERRAAERLAEPLRGLAERSDATVIDDVLATYWESWSWLGQERGEVFAVEVFELAKPPRRKDLEFKFRVRAARGALDRASQRGSPSARAAAAMVLTQCAPQYKSLRQRMIATLVSILPKSKPAAQQRIAWTLARHAGRSFDGLSAENSPEDFSRPAVRDALDWARTSAIAEPDSLKIPRKAYPAPPKLIRRVVTPRRQLERDLLQELGVGWGAVCAMLDRWMDAELGCTPQVEGLLDPGQRDPDYPALAAAMIIAAESNAQHLRPQLDLWSEASDQPAWVRGFAYSVLGVLDARRGRWTSGWPAELDERMIGRPGRNSPDWDLWGHLLAAGGPQLRARLLNTPPDSLSSAMRAKLLRAAEHEARRRPRKSSTP